MTHMRISLILSSEKKFLYNYGNITEPPISIDHDIIKRNSNLNRNSDSSIPKEECHLSERFVEQGNQIHICENSETLNRATLINRINHLQSIDGKIIVHFRHCAYQDNLLLNASPEPCYCSELHCHWSDEKGKELNLANYQLVAFIIDDGKAMIHVPATLGQISREGCILNLPHKSYILGHRRNKRYRCQAVGVELSQSGFFARGELLDFSPLGFRITILPDYEKSISWIHPEEMVMLFLRRGRHLLFTEGVYIVRQERLPEGWEVALSPPDRSISRFEKSQLRNHREHLIPLPRLIFHHPLLNRRVEFEVLNISTTGLCVPENLGRGVLFPGLVIHEMTIIFPGDLQLKCLGQVIYRREENGRDVHCGIAILDMNIEEYSRLAHMLANVGDPQARVSADLEMEELWDFFFDAGFVYPDKYRLVVSHRDALKETYRKLYKGGPKIIKHFTYQKGGQIYSHLSMVKAYDRAWQIQHYASRKKHGKRKGFAVLKQVMHYLNDLYRLPSAKIDYIFCFYRPENRIPNRIFGGFARSLKNPTYCSTDVFSYFLFSPFTSEKKFPEGWALRACSNRDLQEVNVYYKHHSGGLLLEIINLKQGNSGEESLENLYADAGLLRRWKAYSLTHKNALKAVLIVDESEPGLNMSDLLNSIKILITNVEGLSWEVLSMAINKLCRVYKTNKIPILTYPSECMKPKNSSYKIKKYILWGYDARYVMMFIKYMEKTFRMNY